MAFFTSFNKKRLFNVDTSEFDYTKLEDLYKKNGPDWEYQLKAVYIGTKSEFDPETPMVAIDGFYVNLPVHQLEHALSGEYTQIAHGAGLAVLFPAWAKASYKSAPARFARFARQVWDVTEENDEKAALAGIEKMADFFKFIGMPSQLREFDIPENCTDRLSDLCTFGKTRTVKSIIEMDFDTINEIFKSCY